MKSQPGKSLALQFLLAVTLTLTSVAAYAEPFEECPARAYLSQRANATLYSINLVTGHYELLEDDMGAGKINAIGFSVHDRYFYAWSHQHNSVARIGTDYQIESLGVENISSRPFFVGDVSVVENAYYAYRRGSSHGLYRVSLDSESEDYLTMTLVAAGDGAFNMNIYDMAFHPTNGSAYAVASDGALFEIDVEQATSSQIGNIGQSGTFGAAYFDVDGKLYVSRNKDGNIYSIDIDGQNFTAQLFAIGPSSSTNDGARCALAPVSDASDDNLDFGDAPASYGTMLSDNGARHGLPDTPTLFLGASVDGESDGAPAPLSDDEIDAMDDDDGVQFATAFQQGGSAVMLVDASDVGNLNVWMDFDQSGTFDGGEQVVTDRSMSAGNNLVVVAVPAGAALGKTWARFRLSSDSGVPATGGVADGEVEDEVIEVTAADSSTTWYPSRSSWTTIAFEDNWPIEGDYDMNDLVMYLRTGVNRANDQVASVFVAGQIAAVGAAYQNGFAIRLPGIPTSAIDAENTVLSINGSPVERAVLDSATDDATFLITYNTFNYVSPGEDCDFYRTELGCDGSVDMEFELFAPMATPTTSDIAGAFDPFLFATPGAWHGNFFADPPGRSYEIHLKNYAPTVAADTTPFGQEQDGSVPAEGRYYQTTAGLPWALEIPIEWKYPREFMELLWAYPQFEGFVESNGTENQQWYLEENADPFFLFDED